MTEELGEEGKREAELQSRERVDRVGGFPVSLASVTDMIYV